jgi:hypothetical protein
MMKIVMMAQRPGNLLQQGDPARFKYGFDGVNGYG